MDSITHALTGGIIAKAIDDKRTDNWGMIAGITMGYFPDIDFILGLFNRQFYIQYHRDFTHSLILIPLYSIFFSCFFNKMSKKNHFLSSTKLYYLPYKAMLFLIYSHHLAR